MTPNDVRDKLRQEPFEPFLIRMNNGQVHEVRHRDFAVVTKTAVHVFPTPPPGEEIPENRVSIVSLRNISTLEPVEQAA